MIFTTNLILEQAEVSHIIYPLMHITSPHKYLFGVKEFCFQAWKMQRLPWKFIVEYAIVYFNH